MIGDPKVRGFGGEAMKRKRLQCFADMVPLWFVLGMYDIQGAMHFPSVVNKVVQMGCIEVGEVAMEECLRWIRVEWVPSQALQHEKLMRPDKHF